MDVVDLIEDQIVKGSEGYFENDQDLRVTIRIARDFYDFLKRFGENPPAEEIAYVSDTIRSGMDSFFLLADSSRVINVDEHNWSFPPYSNWDFPAFRQRFLRGFERLAKSPEADSAKMLSWLLELTHLELMFVAYNFPSAILEGASRMQLYAITDRHLLPGNQIDALIDLACTWAQHKIDYIQIREKDLSETELARLTERIVIAVRPLSRYTRILLNGPAEIALDAGADGIHLPASSPSDAAEHARNLFAGTGLGAILRPILSYACHSLEEILKVKEESQRHRHASAINTLILYAPVFEKTIHGANPLPGQGLDALKIAVEAARHIRVFALGGVTTANAPSCIAAGAAGISGIRLFINPEWRAFKKVSS